MPDITPASYLVMIIGDYIRFGKTNTDEFTMGSTCETSYVGPSKNPHNTDMVTGGSSGGSAAALAADECIAALGSDTGGSIRQPASFCGVVGIKPTYGLVSRYGLIAHASSLDQIGPMTKTVEDSALILSVIAGYDNRDSTCLDEPVPDYSKSVMASAKGLKIGLPKEYFGEGLLFEMYSKTRSEGFDDEVKRRIMLGTYCLSAGYYDAYYRKAQKVRRLIKEDFDAALKIVDAILTPVSPTPAFPLGSKVHDPLQMYLADIYTISLNLAGLPGISVPAGKTSSNLPVGVQFMGRALDESTLFTIAAALERNVGRVPVAERVM